MNIRELENLLHQLVKLDNGFNNSKLCNLEFDRSDDSVVLTTELEVLRITTTGNVRIIDKNEIKYLSIKEDE